MQHPKGIVVLHNLPHDAAGCAESDAGVMNQVEGVERALQALGITTRRAGVRRLRDVPTALAFGNEDLVFNLVENLEGGPAEAALVPAVCESLARGCTGGSAGCQVVCLDKWQAKAALVAHGVPTPAAAVAAPGQAVPRPALPGGKMIVKPLCVDASEGIDAASVVEGGDPEALARAVERVHSRFHQPALVEQFIGGRELNVSILQREGQLVVMPLAEIDFSAFPPDKPRIVDYAAKWLPETFEYQHTPRIIPARVTEETAASVRDAALRAWSALGCRDYARVDFRLDERDQPYVLEVNPNPDISADAGFAAALAAGGVGFTEFVLAMLDNALARRGVPQGLEAVTLPAGDDAPVTLRRSREEDRDAVVDMVLATGFFHAEEIAIACEVLDEALAHGPNGHYQSFTAVAGDRPVGWICFGPTPCSIGTFDIYWVVTSPHLQRRGVGRAMLEFAEARIAERGGRLAVAETSSRPLYDPTRRFYLTCGYHEASRTADFYAPGDAKVLYVKHIVATVPTP